ncbi:hypothetical protein GJA_5193 [Janthinobacterium agaricidamnosum NBRC 102515 = DSM 9628]|uniref:Uncharacterized protein n=1 Tax=Janthinobacterium agaricidamnosum NBRC 102515 = DSM 9628 TaxID=1349767 RepID=W0VDP2_9BURK|nr:hypothetical protein GJA_5193 [Janthinobacterium agaricidamnosum NBRC 102515 = DSM 9628]
MRSVIRKPPTILATAQATAMVPSVVARTPSALPAKTNDATSEMPEIALVAAMRGVCSKGGMRVIVCIPTKPASRKTKN